MGVVNVTPDSFYDGGSFLAPEQAVEHALQLLDQGADILDIGGESTRPGARVAGEESSAKHIPVSEEEELRRILPVIEGILRCKPEAVISVDTYKASVARAAVNAGAGMVNDVSAFQWDPQMADTCAELECGVVMMHTRGTPGQWRTLPPQADILQIVEHDLANRCASCLRARGAALANRTGSRFRLRQELRGELSAARPPRPVAAAGLPHPGGNVAQVIYRPHRREKDWQGLAAAKIASMDRWPQ